MERILWLFATACLLMPLGPFVSFVFGIEADLRYQTYAVGAVVAVSLFVFQTVGRRAIA